MSTDALAQAQQVARGLLVDVSPDQLGLDTPCANWDVSALIDHIVGGQHWSRSALAGVEMADDGASASKGDFVAAFDDAARENLAAFSAESSLDRMVNPGFGDMPAAALLGMITTDTLTHAWDLAKATGKDANLAPDLATQLLEQSRQSIQDSFRSEDGAVFGLEQPAPEGASPADQLAAFLGRKV